jgi:hypothetical protein
LLVGRSHALLSDQILDRLLIGDGKDHVAHRSVGIIKRRDRDA